MQGHNDAIVLMMSRYIRVVSYFDFLATSAVQKNIGLMQLFSLTAVKINVPELSNIAEVRESIETGSNMEASGSATDENEITSEPAPETSCVRSWWNRLKVRTISEMIYACYD